MVFFGKFEHSHCRAKAPVICGERIFVKYPKNVDDSPRVEHICGPSSNEYQLYQACVDRSGEEQI